MASKTALAMAAATGRIELSPAPAGGNSGRLISTMSTASGASVMSRIGKESQSVLVTLARSKATSSASARLGPWTTLPSMSAGARRG